MDDPLGFEKWRVAGIHCPCPRYPVPGIPSWRQSKSPRGISSSRLQGDDRGRTQNSPKFIQGPPCRTLPLSGLGASPCGWPRSNAIPICPRPSRCSSLQGSPSPSSYPSLLFSPVFDLGPNLGQNLGEGVRQRLGGLDTFAPLGRRSGEVPDGAPCATVAFLYVVQYPIVGRSARSPGSFSCMRLQPRGVCLNGNARLGFGPAILQNSHV